MLKGEYKFMENKKLENNQVVLVGKITSDFTYSHEVFGEGFYMVDVSVKRLSGIVDVIPVMVSERLIDVKIDRKGYFVTINGQYRSFNRQTEGKSKLLLSVFAREIEFLEKNAENIDDNSILLNGSICKTPTYRKTPLGREIADLILAVNRPYGKSDYIPCVCWGRNARFVSCLEVGTRVEILGRIQSRNYIKKISETESEDRIAYEVSISKIGTIEE